MYAGVYSIVIFLKMSKQLAGLEDILRTDEICFRNKKYHIKSYIMKMYTLYKKINFFGDIG